jgi:regulator of replication initiation timing
VDRLDILEKKVHQAADQLSKLRHESQKMRAEIQFLEEENRKAKLLLEDGTKWQEQKKAVSTRIEKIIKRLSALGA